MASPEGYECFYFRYETIFYLLLLIYCSYFRYETIFQEDHVVLYKALLKNEFKYSLVMSIPGSSNTKYMRLFCVPNEEEALKLYSLYSTRVAPLAILCKAISSGTSKLQVMCFHGYPL